MQLGRLEKDNTLVQRVVLHRTVIYKALVTDKYKRI